MGPWTISLCQARLTRRTKNLFVFDPCLWSRTLCNLDKQATLLVDSIGMLFGNRNKIASNLDLTETEHVLVERNHKCKRVHMTACNRWAMLDSNMKSWFDELRRDWCTMSRHCFK